ncbi:MAG TPA: hypothetical protein VLV15_07050 [Dongiaceae bacterium]|nr:hypothetical protein [Dongiaceae bacterium]
MRIRTWFTVAAGGVLVLLVAAMLGGDLPSLRHAVASELATVDANHLPSADALSATLPTSWTSRCPTTARCARRWWGWTRRPTWRC